MRGVRVGFFGGEVGGGGGVGGAGGAEDRRDPTGRNLS